MEEEDVNGYDVNWASGISLTQDFFANDYFSQTTSGSYGLWNAYIEPEGQGPILVGQAWFNQYYDYTQVWGEEETYYQGASNICATINPYMYYGTDGSGNAYGGYLAQVSLNGQSWTPWNSNGDGYEFSNPPYNTSSVSGLSAWKGWGG